MKTIGMITTNPKVAGGVAAGTMWINSSLESLCDIFPENIVLLGAACSALLALVLSVCHVVKSVRDHKKDKLETKKLELELEALRRKEQQELDYHLQRMQNGEELKRHNDFC